MPLVALTLFSAIFLPTFNLMLDVPALALSLGAIALFCRACDRVSFGLAAAAGLVAGLGMETKYTAVLAPATMLLYALCLGRLRLWPVAAVVAAQVFLGWEFLMACLYGESHFLLHLRERAGADPDVVHKMTALVTNLGSVAWPIALVGLVGLGVRWRGLAVAGAIGLAAYAGVICFGGEWQRSEKIFGPSDATHAAVSSEELIFGTLGVSGALLGVAVLWQLTRPDVTVERWLHRLLSGWRTGPSAFWRALAPPRPVRVVLFLLLWLMLELVAYVPMTPFPAVRRLMGVAIVLLLLAGRSAALACRAAAGRQVVVAIAVYSAVLGLLVFGVDLLEARTEEAAVEEAARQIRAEESDATIWFVGHWGFQYYAERAGMQAISAYPPMPAYAGATSRILVPGRTSFKEGDWLVLPQYRWSGDRFAGGVHKQQFTPDSRDTEHAFDVVLDDPIPMQTIITLYSGLSAVVHHEGPRLQVEVRRVTRDHEAWP